MATPLKAVSHAPEDFHILGGESLVYRVASCGGDAEPKVSINSAGAATVYNFQDIPASVDYSVRVVSSSYGDILDHSVGEVNVQANSVCPGFSPNSVQSKINVFDAVDDSNVIEVSDDAQFRQALLAINAGTDNHYLISLQAGSYTAANFIGRALNRDGVLVSIEPDNNSLNQVYITEGYVGALATKKANISWRSIIFRGGGNETALAVTKNTTQVFRNCKFEDAATAVNTQPQSTSRLVSCHSNGCDAGFVGVDVLRSCSAAGLSSSFAIDCGVVEGSLAVTNSLKSAMIYYSSRFSGSVVVANNTLVDQGDSPLLRADCDLVSSQFKGNVYSGTSTEPVILQGIYDTAFTHNTINGADAGDAVTVRAGAKNVRTVNNWIYPLTRKSIKMTQFDSVWKNNATKSDIKFPRTLTKLESPFSNNYMFLRKRTPLRTDGSPPTSNQLFSQGAKVEHGQIGALPFTSDTDLTSVHKSVYERPFFSFSGPTPSTN